MTHGRYQVVGNRRYRGHEPGTVFVALLERHAEARACRRGDICLMERVTPTVAEGSYRFPDGWLPPPRPDVPPAPTEGPGRGLSSSRKE